MKVDAKFTTPDQLHAMMDYCSGPGLGFDADGKLPHCADKKVPRFVGSSKIAPRHEASGDGVATLLLNYRCWEPAL